MTKEEEWQFWHGKNIKTGVYLGLGCPDNGLELEDLVGWVAEGSPQAAAPKGPVHWPFCALEPENANGGKEAEEADWADEDEGTPRSDLFVGIGILLVGILWAGGGGLMV